jgi:hypothetical protein
MNFEEILDHAIAMLRRRSRVTYRTLKRQFELDDDALEDLKDELIYGQRPGAGRKMPITPQCGARSIASW